MAVRFRPAAAADFEHAYRWYDDQRLGLGEEFAAEVGRTIDEVAANPDQFPVVHRDTRRALVRRFPYGIYYRVIEGDVLVVAVFHAKQSPRRWRARR